MFIQNCIPYLWVIVDKTAVRENRLKFRVPVCEEETWRASGQGGRQMVPFWGGSAFDTTPRWRWPWSEPGSHRHRWWCLCTWSPCCPLLLRLPLLQEESKGLEFVRARLSLTKSFSCQFRGTRTELLSLKPFSLPEMTVSQADWWANPIEFPARQVYSPASSMVTLDR